MLRGVLLDWGGVICEDPSAGFLRYCSQALGVNDVSLAAALRLHLPRFMQGLSEDAFWLAIGEELGRSLGQPRIWGEALASVYHPLTKTLDLARKLQSQGVRIGLLTNTEAPSREFHLQLGYDFFYGRVFSCEEGLVKPDPAIYRLAAERVGLAPEECLMVDDRPENIIGAAKVGMLGHLFTSPALFEHLLLELRLLEP